MKEKIKKKHGVVTGVCCPSCGCNKFIDLVWFGQGFECILCGATKKAIEDTESSGQAYYSEAKGEKDVGRSRSS